MECQDLDVGYGLSMRWAAGCLWAYAHDLMEPMVMPVMNASSTSCMMFRQLRESIIVVVVGVRERHGALNLQEWSHDLKAGMRYIEGLDSDRTSESLG